MFWRRLKISIPVSALVFLFLQTAVHAEEKRVEVEFDRNSICCIMNADRLSSMLQAIEGINVASYSERKRLITLYYEKMKIDIPGIVAGISKITGVKKEWLIPGTPD